MNPEHTPSIYFLPLCSFLGLASCDLLANDENCNCVDGMCRLNLQDDKSVPFRPSKLHAFRTGFLTKRSLLLKSKFLTDILKFVCVSV